MIRQNPLGNFAAAAMATSQQAQSMPVNTPSTSNQSSAMTQQPVINMRRMDEDKPQSMSMQPSSTPAYNPPPKRDYPVSTMNTYQPVNTTSHTSMFGGVGIGNQDDESTSLYNMYGFKQSEGNIQDIFKFVAASKNMIITENMFKHVQMQNGNVWVLTNRNHLIWKATLDNLASEERSRVTEVDEDILKRKPIKKMFVDPRGLHCFFLAEHEIYYNHWQSNRVYQVTNLRADTSATSTSQHKAFKSIDIQYVAPNDYETFEILLGTEDGQIFHACLQFSLKSGLEMIDSLRCVFETHDYRPILDIKVAKIAGNQIVLAITDQCLHQFHSNKNVNLKSTFSDYINNPALVKDHTIKIDAAGDSHNKRETYQPSQSSLYSDEMRTTARTGEESTMASADEVSFHQLRLYVTNSHQGSEDDCVVGGFGWMNEYGFYYASYNPDEYIIKKKSLEVTNYLKKENDTVVENVLPHAFAVTQFHIVYMFPKNITVLSKISREIVYSQRFDDQDVLQGIVLDHRKNRLLLYGKQAPLLIAYLKGEDQDAWRYYLRREQFGQALANCKNGKQRAFAAGYYADHLFKREKFDKAADYYAQSDKTFEEVALKFLHSGRYSDLVLYLERILKAIDPKREDLQPQRMLLYTWIVELKLNQINSLQASAASITSSKEAKEAEEEIAYKQKKFHDFLKEHAGSLGQAGHDTVFQLLQSHGKINECIRFAEDVGAHEAVIVHYINKQEYKRALEKVERIPDRKTKNQVMLRYASVFIKNLPELTIEALSKFEDIDVPKLVPAFMNIPRNPVTVLDKAKNFVIDYCINKRKSTEKTVHNLALYFYAERNKPDELLAFLRHQESTKDSGSKIYFEVDYALNVCKQKEKELVLSIDNKRRFTTHSTSTIVQQQTQKEIADLETMIPKLKRAQIILYAILGLFDKAVKISLECHDIDMAKDYANKPNDKKLKKKLWMKIAKYLFKYQSKKAQAKVNKPLGGLGTVVPSGTSLAPQKPGEVDVTKALEILKDSVLKIDDLLPLFPEDAKVEDMKKHLCECLDQYNSKILELKQQLSEHSKSAEELRKKQRKQRHKHITINPQQECDICQTSIFKREFYVFPCLHAFHRECIYRQLRTYQTKDPRVDRLVQKLCGLFNKIETIKAKAAFVHTELNQGGGGSSSGSMMMGAFGVGSKANANANNQYDDSNKNSLISDIKNYFTKSVRAGMIPTQGSGPGGQTNQILQQRDQEEIRHTLNQIDDLLTRECFFCGSLLLDMIDNDVFTGSGQSKDFETYYSISQEEINQIASIGEEEWKIQ